MSVIAVLTADRVADDDTDIGRLKGRTAGATGGVVPTGVAGYQHDGAVYCPTCAASETVVCAETDETYTLAQFPSDATTTDGSSVGLITGTSETDYPGDICDGCECLLDTNVLVYDGGGAHPHPVVRVQGDDDAEPVTAFVLYDLDDHVELIYAQESDDREVESGEIATVPREWVVEGLDD
jgi:hypothetical protein